MPFTLYVIQSAHTDIGFTHPQEQIALMYLDYYDRVLDLCRATAHVPEAHRFKWVCETSWQVRHYVTARPEREAEFLSYVRSGQIEITASYLHFTDMTDPDAYRRSLEWIVDYCHRHHLPLKCAMHCDINGWSWALPDILSDYKIPHFLSQIHVDMATDPLGRRGSVHYHWVMEWGDRMKPDTPIRVPQGFWWQGPQGGKVLHWLNEHYHLGNNLGISSNYPFGADKTRYFSESDPLNTDHLYRIAQREVPKYVERIRAEGYPYDIMLVSTGGYYVDNSPPDGRWCDVIARWNAEHDGIRMRTATVSEWFEAFERLEPQLPTYQVAWPDHWAHGLGSSTARIAQGRRTQRRRAAALALVEKSNSSLAAAHLATALEQERLALEHTFDAWCTTERPAAVNNAFQQATKDLAFHRAELYLDEAVGAALRVLTAPVDSGQALYAVSAVRGNRLLHFDAGDLHLDPARHQLINDQDQVIPFQEDFGQLRQFVAILPVSDDGIQRLRLIETPQVSAQPKLKRLELETESWKLRVDRETGGLQSMIERRRGREWVQANGRYTFGQLVHEAIVHPKGREAVRNFARMIAQGVASDTLHQEFSETPIFEYSTPPITDEPCYQAGPVFDQIMLNSHQTRIGSVRMMWRVYHQIPLVEFVLEWDKLWSDLPEAAYVAFPFAVRNGHLELETSGGFFQPGSHEACGQLPGTCSSYYTVQRAARITSDGASLLWLPLDAPLVMPNEIKYNRWEIDPWRWNGFLASMPVNHYWHTNFPTSQRGLLRLRYRIFCPDAPLDDEIALQTALPLDGLGWR